MKYLNFTITILICFIYGQGAYAAENQTLSEQEDIVNFTKELIEKVPLSVEILTEMVPGANFKKINTHIVSYDTYICENVNKYITEIKIRTTNLPGKKAGSHTSVQFYDLKFNQDDVIKYFGKSLELDVPTANSPVSVPNYYTYITKWGSYSFGISRTNQNVVSLIVEEKE